MLLKTMNSLPEDERNAVLDRYSCSQSVLGQSAPAEECKQARTKWVVVPDDGPGSTIQDGNGDGGGNGPEWSSSPNNDDDDDDWVSATGNADTAGSDWKADDAQAHYPESNLDSVPFKFEGMSYTSSSRAASRLRAPGQLTVLLRAEAGVVDD